MDSWNAPYLLCRMWAFLGNIAICWYVMNTFSINETNSTSNVDTASLFEAIEDEFMFFRVAGFSSSPFDTGSYRYLDFISAKKRRSAGMMRLDQRSAAGLRRLKMKTEAEKTTKVGIDEKSRHEDC